MKNKLLKLEAIRGFASLYVVFHHSFFSKDFIMFGHNLSFIFKFGLEAVILFFLMSGFVIGYSFERSSDKSFYSYFPKRFYRIYIPLIIVFITHYLIKSYQSGLFVNPNWMNLLGNVFMLQDTEYTKPNVICDPYLLNAPLWSLSYEWWFYMAFFLFFVILPKTKKGELYICLVVILSALSYIVYPFIFNRLLMYFGIWWTGVVMARSYLKNGFVRIIDLKYSLLMLLITTLVLAANSLIHKNLITKIGEYPLLELRNFAFTIIVIGLALLWQKLKWQYFDLVFGKFALLASSSYVLYISHYFLVKRAHYLDFLDNKYAAFFIYLLVAFICAYTVEVVLYPRIKRYLSGELTKKKIEAGAVVK